jgi:hypothetical protein
MMMMMMMMMTYANSKPIILPKYESDAQRGVVGGSRTEECGENGDELDEGGEDHPELLHAREQTKEPQRTEDHDDSDQLVAYKVELGEDRSNLGA